MSTNNLRTLASRIPKFSLRGVAYLAAANFLARAIILVKTYIITYFHSEMILIYGATLDTRILLFFQTIYMIPMFLLGVLLFFGIERESFNLVLYPTLMLVFLILIRYGSEAALLAVHWEDHKRDQTPELIFTLIQDIIFIGLLLLYIYMCLAFTPIKPTPLELLEGGNSALASAATSQGIPGPSQHSPVEVTVTQSTSQSLAPPQPQHAPGDPDSQGFNYALRRNIGQIPKDSTDKAMLDEIERQRQRNSLILKEKEGGSVIETDLDAVPTTVPNSESTPAEDQPTSIFKLSKFKKSAAKKPQPEAVVPKEEPPAEPEVDFWGNINGDADTPPKTDSYKTTSV